MNYYRCVSWNSLYSTEWVKKDTKAEGREEQRKTHLIVARPNRRLDGLASAVCSIILDDYEVVLLNTMHRSPLVIVAGSVGVYTPS